MTNLNNFLNNLPEGVHIQTVAGTAAEDLMLKVYLDGVATGAGTIVYSNLLNQDVPEPDANKHAHAIAHHLYADPLRRAEILTEIQERFHELQATGTDHPDFTVPCEHCGGTGFEPMTGKFRDSHTCSICKGEGETEIRERFHELPATGIDHPDGTEEG